MKRIAVLLALASSVFLADLVSQPGLSEGRWVHPASTQASGATAQTRPSPPRSTTDSTQRSVAAGDVLITALPERVGDRAVQAYEMLRAPARSNLAGRSFFWRTRSADAGRHRLLFRARFDTTAADDPADSLTVLVTVE